MTRILNSLLFLLTFAAPAQEHYLLRTEQPLHDSERRDLAARGVVIERVLPAGAYLVRTTDAASIDGLTPLTPELKIHGSVYREAARGFRPLRLHVLFHEEVTFDDARVAVASAGAALDDPLVIRFGYMRQLTVLVPRASLHALAADERVFMLSAAPRLQIKEDNWQSAGLSNISQLHQPPYDLTGDGVVLSQFEGYAAWAEHPEFEGRLTLHFEDTARQPNAHATHVAGTMIAAGLSSYARGMAPDAELHQFRVEYGTEEWQLDKDQQLVSRGVVADNNSWSYVIGWIYRPGGSGYVWTGREELWGAYDPIRTAAIDKITRERGILFVHSAGNDGPVPATGDYVFHRHLGPDGEPDLEKTWCYSRDGSGIDCPQPQCSAGPPYCETTRHHPLSPFDTMSVTASAKNAVAVGAVDLEKKIASLSSRGPAKDGRVKPDLVARGVDVLSTGYGSGLYLRASGTSMAAPVVTGTAALLTEQWRRTYGTEPGPAVLKALLIAGAEDLGHAGPDYTFGFGLVNGKASVDLIRQQRSVRTAILAQGEQTIIPVVIEAPTDVRIVLQWLDPEVIFTGGDSPTAKSLVNDLDLAVIDPAGELIMPYILNPSLPDSAATRGTNDTDNTEVVEFTADQTGTFHVVVRASRIATRSPQQAVIVSTAPFSGELPLARRRRAVGR